MQVIAVWLLLFALPAGYIIRRMEGLLVELGMVRLNYERQLVPTGSGLYVYTGMVGWAVLTGVFSGEGWLDGKFTGFVAGVTEFTMAAGAVFAAGWLDDAAGQRHIKGFRGHIGQFVRHGVLSTGMIKLLAVGAAATWLALLHGGGWPIVLLRWLVMCLAANALNLLDLRPGRTIKTFVLGVLALSYLAPDIVLRYGLPAVTAVMLLLPRELKHRCMLGDAGANLLGFVLGYMAAVSLPASALAIVAFALVVMHWTAERRSLTELIERNRLLRAIDRLGRG